LWLVNRIQSVEGEECETELYVIGWEMGKSRVGKLVDVVQLEGSAVRVCRAMGFGDEKGCYGALSTGVDNWDTWRIQVWEMSQVRKE